MKRLFSIIFCLILPSFVWPQAESDLDERSPHPVLQQQTDRIRDELAEKEQRPKPRPAAPRPGYLLPVNAESDTDTRVPHPIMLKQRDLILKELAEKPHDPAITAQVKAKWNNQYKRNDGHQTRGVHAVVPVSIPTASTSTVAGTPMKASANRYVTEIDLYIDYETKWNWIEGKIQFKNDMGIESGTSNKISLEKAWIGYDFFDNCWGDLDGEIGRKPCDEIFDSRLLFSSTYDGLLMTWRHRWEETGEVFIHGGPDLVDARTTQFAGIVEAGWEKAFMTGAYSKLSLSWWRHEGADRYNVYNSPKYRYILPQLLIGYDLAKDYFGFPVVVYAAGIYNFAAKPTVSSAGKKRGAAWYAAIQLGKLKKCGDFFFDICFQSVGAQAIPNFDNAGMGRGNSTSWGDLPAITDPTDPANFTPNSAVLTVPADQVQGNANYNGVEVRFYYNITDELTVRAKADASRQKTRAVGGGNTFRQGEIQLIYGF